MSILVCKWAGTNIVLCKTLYTGTVDSTVAAKPAIVMPDGVHPDVELPGWSMEDGIDRREGQKIQQRRPFYPRLIRPIVVPYRDGGHFNLGIGRIADFRIEQIMISRTNRRFLKRIVVPPTAPYAGP